MKSKVVIVALLAGGLLLGAMLWHASQRAKPPDNAGEMQAGQDAAPDAEDDAGMASTVQTTGTDSKAAGALTDAQIKARASLNETVAQRAQLKPEQVRTLMNVLREVSPEDAGQSGHVYKNELMNALNRREKLSPNTIPFYTEIYRNEKQNEVVRDYAIQHVYEAYGKLADAKDRSGAVKLLQDAAADPSSSIAGTAILALARLSNTDTNLARADIAATAFNLAQNPSANVSARISALQVIGQLDAQQAVPVLVEAASQASSTTERISAIGALGLVGGKDQLPLLQTIVEGNNARLKPAAVAALARIQQRTGGS